MSAMHVPGAGDLTRAEAEELMAIEDAADRERRDALPGCAFLGGVAVGIALAIVVVLLTVVLL
jgi:hypothetical protein